MKLNPRIIYNDFKWTICKPNWIGRNLVRCRVTVESVKTGVCFSAWMGEPWRRALPSPQTSLVSWYNLKIPYLSPSSPKYTLPWEQPVSPLSGIKLFVSSADVKEIPLTGVIFTITERGQWTRTGSHLSCVSAVDEMLDLGKKKEIFLWKIICK